MRRELIVTLILATLFCAMLLFGCGPTETGLPEFGGVRVRDASYYFPPVEKIPIGYGPRANERDGKAPQASGRLEGIGVELVGEEYVVTWSLPAKNDVSPMQAVARASCSVGVCYAENGAPTSYRSAEEQVEVEPGQTRLISGKIRIPKAAVSRYAWAYRPDMIVDSVAFQGPLMDGVAFVGDGLTFSYLGTKDGFASAQWVARAVRATHRITATCTDSAGRPISPAVLDTSERPVTATCVLYDRDGKEVARDVCNLGPRKAGDVEATGVFRLPEATWKVIDWKKAKVDWDATRPGPAEKPVGLAPAPRTERLLVTGYCACRRCCGPRARGICADGSQAGPWFAAADWSVYPPGTKMVVPGFGLVEIRDKGSKVRGRHIDVFFWTHREAREWGRPTLDVTVLGRQGERNAVS